MFWALKPGCVDWSVCFRDSVGDGITPGQKNRKQELVGSVQKVLDDALVESVGPNKWVGDAKPTFSFVTLAPKQIGVDAWVYDSMILRPGDWYRVRKTDDSSWTWRRRPAPSSPSVTWTIALSQIVGLAFLAFVRESTRPRPRLRRKW